MLTKYNAAGEQMLNESGFAPQGVVFFANASAAGAATTGWRKIPIDTKQFDPFNFFSTANNRFQPTIPGYYRLSGNVYWPSGVGGGAAGAGFWKNGTLYHEPLEGTQPYMQSVSTVMYLNGTTDYAELYGWAAASIASQGSGGGFYTSFQGELVAASVGVAPEPWHTVGAPGEPAFAASFSAWTTVGFFKDPHSIVHLRGLMRISDSGEPINTTCWTMPVGYRIGQADEFPIRCNVNQTSLYTIRATTSGAITVSAEGAWPAGSPVVMYLGAVHYRAEQ